VKYRQDNKFEARFDPARCAEAVHDAGRGVGFHQCGRKWKVTDANGDRWCAQHDPQVVADKRTLREQQRQQKGQREADWRRRMNVAAGRLGIGAQLHWQPFTHEYQDEVVISLADFEKLAEQQGE
jgi:hypothetical protein